MFALLAEIVGLLWYTSAGKMWFLCLMLPPVWVTRPVLSGDDLSLGHSDSTELGRYL